MQNLISLANRYLEGRQVSPAYASNLLRTAQKCRLLSKDSINEYLKRRLSEVSAITAKSERTMLLTVWRFAYDAEIVDLPPRGVMKFRVTREPTRAWTREELRKSIEVAKNAAGRMRSGAKVSDYLECWIRLGYETGARHGDLRSFRVDQITEDVIRWTQSKTGDPLEKVLSPACLDAVRRLSSGSNDGTIMGWCCGKRMAMQHMRNHLDSCGLSGTSKWLRRAGATHIEMISPGKAKLHLGHRSVGLAERNYLDWGQIRRTTPITPSLDEPCQSQH